MNKNGRLYIQCIEVNVYQSSKAIQFSYFTEVSYSVLTIIPVLMCGYSLKFLLLGIRIDCFGSCDPWVL